MEENLVPFSIRHFLRVSHLYSDPVSILIWEIILIFLYCVDIPKVRSSITSIHASLILSCIPMILKIFEYLSHRIKKNLYLDYIDNSIDSRFHTVSIWISSREHLAFVILNLSFEAIGIVIALQEVCILSAHCVTLASSHKSWALLVIITPLDLLNISCIVFVITLVFIWWQENSNCDEECKVYVGIVL